MKGIRLSVAAKKAMKCSPERHLLGTLERTPNRSSYPDTLTRPTYTIPSGALKVVWVPLPKLQQAEGLQERDEFLQAFSLRSVCLGSRLPGATPLAMFLRPFRAPVSGWRTSAVRDHRGGLESVNQGCARSKV